MIFILFGIWLMSWILVAYFSRKVQHIEDEIISTTTKNQNSESESESENQKNENSENENSENNKDSENENSENENSENNKDNDSEYIGDTSETEDGESENKEVLLTKINTFSKLEKFYQDPITGRRFSRKWISSQIPYTKGNHFWLFSREDLLAGDKKKNSIEVVRNMNTKTLTIRFWDDNRIDGPELIFMGPSKTLIVSLFKKGKLCEIDSDVTRFSLIHQHELLYNFYCSSSLYVKNLNLGEFFTH